MRAAQPRYAVITIRSFCGAVVLGLCTAGPLSAQQPSMVRVSSVQGAATDSIRGQVLAGAFIELLPAGRQVMTGPDGRFRFDSVPPADGYRLRVMHALIDTLGISLTTPAFSVGPSESRNIDIAVPSPSRLVKALCPPSMLARGPAALVGFVRDPDTGAAIDNVTLSLLYDESPISKIKIPVNRVAHPDAAGRYTICGLPSHMDGRLKLSRNGVESGDIPVAIDVSSPLTLRGLGLAASSQRVTAAPGGPEKALRLLRGDATLRGRVVDKSGIPVASARIQMDGTLAVATSKADGSFRLDSVPLGTQSISVRKIGYGVTDHAVDVERTPSAPIVVTMADYVQTLAPVVTIAQRTKDLDAVGFTRRKERGLGVFREGDQIDKGPTDVGESLRMIPGLHIGTDANSQTSQKTLIMSSRDANECVNIIIDGVLWQDAASSIEEYVRPEEIEALEMYHSATVPGEFAIPGKSKCAVVVLWTKRRIHPSAPQANPPG